MTPQITPIDSFGSALLARLHGMCFSEPWTEDAFARLSAMPGAFAFLASADANLNGSRDRTPIGFALAREGGGDCEIISLGVVPTNRCKGVGAALVGAVAAQAEFLQVENLVLEVAADNVSAIALYQTTAFVAVGRRKNYYRGTDGNRIDAIVMRRTLTT